MACGFRRIKTGPMERSVGTKPNTYFSAFSKILSGGARGEGRTVRTGSMGPFAPISLPQSQLLGHTLNTLGAPVERLCARPHRHLHLGRLCSQVGGVELVHAQVLGGCPPSA